MDFDRIYTARYFFRDGLTTLHIVSLVLDIEFWGKLLKSGEPD